MLPPELDDYLNELRAAGRDARTMSSYHGSLTSISRIVEELHGPEKCLLDLTRAQVIELYVPVFARFSGSTAKHYLRVLAAFYKWAQAVEVIERNPMQSLPRPRVGRKEQPALNVTQAQALLASATVGQPWPARSRLVLLLAFCCGLRAGEIASLRLSAFTHNAEDGAPGVLVTGKGRHERWVPFPSAVRTALAAYLPEREARLLKYGHNLVDVDTLLVAARPSGSYPVTDPERMELKSGARVGSQLQDVFKSVGLPRTVGLHAARRGFATAGCADGGPFDTYTMEVALGHAGEGTLRRYRYVSHSELSAGFERHPMNLTLGGWLRAAA